MDILSLILAVWYPFLFLVSFLLWGAPQQGVWLLKSINNIRKYNLKEFPGREGTQQYSGQNFGVMDFALLHLALQSVGGGQQQLLPQHMAQLGGLIALKSLSISYENIGFYEYVNFFYINRCRLIKIYKKILIKT